MYEIVQIFELLSFRLSILDTFVCAFVCVSQSLCVCEPTLDIDTISDKVQLVLRHPKTGCGCGSFESSRAGFMGRPKAECVALSPQKLHSHRDAEAPNQLHRNTQIYTHTDIQADSCPATNADTNADSYSIEVAATNPTESKVKCNAKRANDIRMTWPTFSLSTREGKARRVNY